MLVNYNTKYFHQSAIAYYQHWHVFPYQTWNITLKVLLCSKHISKQITIKNEEKLILSSMLENKYNHSPLKI